MVSAPRLWLIFCTSVLNTLAGGEVSDATLSASV